MTVIAVLAVCAAIGMYGGRFLSPGRWLTLYFCGALWGMRSARRFSRIGGTSGRFVGILGGLAHTRCGSRAGAGQVEAAGGVGIPLAVLDTALATSTGSRTWSGC